VSDMTAYPSMVDYQEHLQHPRMAFRDAELQRGFVESSALGIPFARSGGFALTYKLTTGSKMYAIRCFHRSMPHIEGKYASISTVLERLASKYFTAFSFRQDGIRIKGASYPIVVMDWLDADTLGIYLERNYNDANAMRSLQVRFRELAGYLENVGIAHGDIQNGNVMVYKDSSMRLIDYDGMWVPGLPVTSSSEAGHKHFQHPERTSDEFGPWIDRFSFISIDVSLQALIADPSLFRKYSEGGEAIIFKANDYRDPNQSEVFKTLWRSPSVKEPAERLAELCVAPIRDVPSLADFLNGKASTARPSSHRTPQPLRQPAPTRPARYIGAYDVIDASDYVTALLHVGDKIELIGRVVDVKNGVTRYGKPYVFVNFGDWRTNCVRITIWSEGLSTFGTEPSQSWAGRWISVTGLVEPPYRNPARFRSEQVGIVVSNESQVSFLSEQEAQFRLTGDGQPSPHGQVDTSKPSSNRDVLDAIRSLDGSRPEGGAPTSAARPTGGRGLQPAQGSTPTSPIGTRSLKVPQPVAQTSNQRVLAEISRMKQGTMAPSPPVLPAGGHQAPSGSGGAKSSATGGGPSTRGKLALIITPILLIAVVVIIWLVLVL
jgi:hypothetical protein